MAEHRPIPTLEEHLPDNTHRECECCNSSGVPLKVYRGSDGSKRDGEFKALCGLCAGTYLGVMDDWPRIYGQDVMQLGKIIAFVGNEILKRLPPQLDDAPPSAVEPMT